MSLAEKLVALRKQKGLTQADLAEKINVSRQAISRWEVGLSVPSTDNLVFLSRLYNVPVDYLLQEQPQSFCGEEEMFPLDAGMAHLSQRKRCLLLASVCAAILIVVGTVCAFLHFHQKDRAPTPISKMDYTDEIQSTVGTFIIYDIMEEGE